MSFFAHFRVHEGSQFRLDTRIYLDDEEPGDCDTCVAAIIGTPPGTANGTVFDRLAPIALGTDQLLPTVRYRFRSAFERAGVEIPSGHSSASGTCSISATRSSMTRLRRTLVSGHRYPATPSPNGRRSFGLPGGRRKAGTSGCRVASPASRSITPSTSTTA